MWEGIWFIRSKETHLSLCMQQPTLFILVQGYSGWTLNTWPILFEVMKNLSQKLIVYKAWVAECGLWPFHHLRDPRRETWQLLLCACGFPSLSKCVWLVEPALFVYLRVFVWVCIWVGAFVPWRYLVTTATVRDRATDQKAQKQHAVFDFAE